VGVSFPIFEHTGVKTVMNCTGRVVDPDNPDRSVDQAQLDIVREYVDSALPTLGQDIIAAETCRYTMTPMKTSLLIVIPHIRTVSSPRHVEGTASSSHLQSAVLEDAAP
jgi:hypothetical protein